MDQEADDDIGGSFLVGVAGTRSDIDLVCYGPRGYEAAQKLFTERSLIHPYEGETLTQLYLRRAKYMAGCPGAVFLISGWWAGLG
ncbi:hypothetical protein ABZ154_34555 [Streptomyces sp. NPDC006261]|uniref:hypothetical protein n=1 Tax=Streptomyces sp. NPDC006261 TaxID=3156739 RepID=UPI0033AB78FF